MMDWSRLSVDGLGRTGPINVALIIFSVMAFFFAIADLQFYGVIGNLPCSAANCSSTIPKPSVKLMMQDHMCHYIHHYSAEAFEDSVGLSRFPFITPNFITTVHLFVGVLAAYMAASEHLKIRQLSVGLFQLRLFLDTMDGVVYRRQLHTTVYVNGWGTVGYYVDAVADIVASFFLIYGLLVFLLRHPLHRRGEVLPTTRSSPDSALAQPDVAPLVSRQTIQLTMFLCVLQGGFRVYFWDKYQRSFHLTLGKVMHRKSDALLQARIFNSPLTRFVLWVWKVSSAEGMLSFMYLSIFLDCIWPMLVLIRKYGFIQLAVAAVITQLHTWQVNELLAKAR